MPTEALGIKTKNGTTIVVPPSLRVLTTYVLLEQETWFEDELAFAEKCVPRGEGAIDVGANFGLYSTALAQAAGSEGVVLAFEPAANTTRFLRATVGLQPAVTVRVEQIALSDHDGHAQLSIDAGPESYALAPAGETPRVAETVALAALDNYLATRLDRPPSFLKLDAEGHEVRVIAGARNTLQLHQPVIQFEIKHGRGFDFGMLDPLAAHGYTFFRLIPALGALLVHDREDPLDAYQINLFACAGRRKEELQRRGLIISDQENAPHPAPPSTAANADEIFCQLGREPDTTGSYSECLTEYLRFSGAARTNDRYRHLCNARRLSIVACQEKESHARIITRARIARDLGLRAEAVKTLQPIVEAIVRNADWAPDEPCLWPSVRAGVEEKSAEPARLKSAVLEAVERWRAYSSFYPGTNLSMLDHICAQPHCSPDMHRRRQLARMRAGLQSRPEPHPALVVSTPENLNPWFWRGEF